MIFMINLLIVSYRKYLKIVEKQFPRMLGDISNQPSKT